MFGFRRGSFPALIALSGLLGCATGSLDPAGEPEGAADGGAFAPAADPAAPDAAIDTSSSAPVVEDPPVATDTGTAAPVEDTATSAPSADASVPDTATADSGSAVDTAMPDTSTADTSVVDGTKKPGKPDTSVVDTGSALDTSVVDTAVADSAPKPDTAVADTAVADTAVADTAVVDTGTAPKYVTHELTFYGWPDNDPPGPAIAHPGLHKQAGGVGTYEDPVTFATDPKEFAPGTRLYVPMIEKYVIMEDTCAACITDWSAGKRHIDVWMNSNSTNTTKLLACQYSWTRPAVDVEINPPAGRKVNTTPLFEPATGVCLPPPP